MTVVFVSPLVARFSIVKLKFPLQNLLKLRPCCNQLNVGCNERLESLEMSATQAWPNVAEVLCQSK